MLDGKNVLIMGARSGGYGEGIAMAAVRAGANVYGTTLDPEDKREKEFFDSIGVTLIPIPLRFDSSDRDQVKASLEEIQVWLRSNGVDRLDSVIHTIAGGFPRHPAVMNAVGDILEGRSTFSDLATPVKREVHYVNAGSFEDSIEWLEGITDPDTVFMALTYRGELPYFIYPTKIQLERIALRMASKGKRTLIAALPEAWTQSSQFFKGIEIGVLGNYLEYIRNQQTVSEDIAPLHRPMEDELAQIKDIETLLQRVEAFIQGPWSAIGRSSEPGEVTRLVDRLFKEMRSDGSFPDLRKSVEIISRFVREASGWLVVREFLHKRAFDPGDVRQIYYSDLMGLTEIKKAPKRPDKTTERIEISEEWYRYGRDEISETLSMYGDNFLFVDEVIMEAGPFHEGFMGFGRFTVPSPDDNPILKDHFVGLPLFGGHLQMEMAGQVGTFMVRKLTEAHGLMPILTGSSFPALNTMAPPGETLKVRISVSLPEKRNLTAEALIENQFATSKGKIRGMLVAERVLRKMLRSFDTER